MQNMDTIPTLCVVCNLFVEVPAGRKNAVCPYCKKPYDVKRGEELYYADVALREAQESYMDRNVPPSYQTQQNQGYQTQQAQSFQPQQTQGYQTQQAQAFQTQQAQSYQTQQAPAYTGSWTQTKFCKFCASVIDKDCVVCPCCGKQIEPLKVTSQPVYYNQQYMRPVGKPKDRTTALILWLFFGIFGGHKFYEGRMASGILYICTLGGFGICWFFDFFRLISKPKTYYVE